jgi:Domain of unknown function (DUF4350)
MPVALDPSDRKLLWVSGALMLVLLAGIAFTAPPDVTDDETLPSIYSPASGGARAAFLLLQDLHRNVQPWEHPPTELPEDSEGDVLILANPTETPGDPERKALMQFAQSGGRILFTGANIGDFFPSVSVSEKEGPHQLTSFRARVPSFYSRGASKIVLKSEATWEEDDPPHIVLYGDEDSAAIVSWPIGKGEILWWAAPTPLTNAGITREENLNLFINAVSDGSASESEQTVIYWDEYFHGEQASLWSYFQKTPVPWGLVQFALLASALLFTFSRRSGPTAMPRVVSRLAPLEFVDTLGGLYERAHAEPAVVGVVLQRFRAILTRQLRISKATSDAALEQAVQERLGRKDKHFLETLQRADAASRSRRTAPADALTMIQKLEGYEEQLGLKIKMKKDKL